MGTLEDPVVGMAPISDRIFPPSTSTRWAFTRRISFWGLNIGLALMVLGSLFPGGVFQVWDVVNNGYWHARGLDYLNESSVRFIEWMRMPGDVVFIALGVVPVLIATTLAYRQVRASG